MKKAPAQKFILPIRHWIETLVIPYNLCPFARKELIQNTIRFSVIEQTEIPAMLEAFVAEIMHLQEASTTETTLVIFPEVLADFEDYLDFVDLSQQILELQGFLGVFQLASFHPDYCFADVTADDASNYTNRAPYPIVHILRESSIENALERYEDAQNIPVQNIKTMQRLGTNKLQVLLENCSKP